MTMDDDPAEGAIRAAPMDLSAANPEIFAALAKAQSEVETVGKDGTNTQREYSYATAEAMIRGSRGPLGANGLAVFSTWSRDDTTFQPGGDIGQQFVCATVRVHWVCSHAGGGIIRGTAEIDAIGSRARPPDKAIAATLTYVRGFLLRDLLNMDRDQVDPKEVVDQRSEPTPDPKWDKFQALIRQLMSARKLVGEAGEAMAYKAIKDAADTFPGDGGPDDAQLDKLMDAATRLLRPPKSEPTPIHRLNAILEKLAKRNRATMEETRAAVEQEADVAPDGKPTAAQTVTLLGAAERLLAADVAAVEQEADGWRTAARAHVTARVADYKRAEGEEPSKETVDGFWVTVQAISTKAARVKAFASATATPKQLTAAAAALDTDREKRAKANGGS